MSEYETYEMPEPEHELCTATRSMIAAVVLPLWKPLVIAGLICGLLYGLIFADQAGFLHSFDLGRFVQVAQVTLWFFPFCLGLFIFAWVLPEVFYVKKSMSLELTTHRLIFRHGVAHTSMHELTLSRISGVDVDQGPLGKLFGYGNIRIHGMGDIFAMPDVQNVQEFYERLQDAREGRWD